MSEIGHHGNKKIVILCRFKKCELTLVTAIHLFSLLFWIPTMTHNTVLVIYTRTSNRRLQVCELISSFQPGIRNIIGNSTASSELPTVSYRNYNVRSPDLGTSIWGASLPLPAPSFLHFCHPLPCGRPWLLSEDEM